MSQMFAGKLIAAAVSAVFALWDVRFRKAPLWFFCLTGAAGIVFAALSRRNVSEVLLSAVPGVLLLLLSKVTEGGIGAGDGLFFISVAGFLAPKDSVLALLSALVLAALAALFLFAAGKGRKTSIPFLALTAPALVLLMLIG